MPPMEVYRYVNIRSLMHEHTVVVHAGRRFVCRKPTCSTVTLALGSFGAEILGFRRVYRQSQAVFDAVDAIPLALRHIKNLPRLASVLATCCELHDGAPGELEELLAGRGGRMLAGELIAGILSLCDLERLIAATEMDRLVDELEKEPAPGPAVARETDGPSAMELLAASLGERFGVAPHEVMTWPYLEVIDLAERILPALARIRRGKGPEVFGLSAEEWEDEGVTLH